MHQSLEYMTKACEFFSTLTWSRGRKAKELESEEMEGDKAYIITNEELFISKVWGILNKKDVWGDELGKGWTEIFFIFHNFIDP